MTDNSKLNTTQPKPQMQQTDYTQAQNLNDKEFDSMFDVLETSSMSTDEEDYIESPPRKISRTVCQQSARLEGLAAFSIKNSNNIATTTENYAVVAATSTSTSTSNNANMEVDDGTANLLQSGYSSSNTSSSSQNGNDIQQQQCDLKESPTQYSRSSTTTDTSSSCLLDMTPPEHALAMLKMENMLLYIKDRVTVIGRNSTTSNVDFHVASSSFVSRKHFQINFDPECGEFFLTCGSKNGIFVDDELQRCNAQPTKLPKSCIFRFPSTELLIHFENYVYKNLSRRQMDCDIFVPLRSESTPIETIDAVPDPDLITGDAIPSCSSATTATTTQDTVKLTERINNQSTEVYSTLKISIPNLEAHSNPYPSPTGTISAANSCPASPRHSFPDYQTFCANGNRNNLNNDDAFRTPSTSSHNEIEKPPYSYAQLIIQSISSAPEKQLTLSGIYTFISKNYPYYRMEANKGWQNSIRHNLSLNRYFIKVPRSQDEPGKGSFWRIDPNSEAKLINSSYKTRRQRSVVNFKRPLIDKPHSAPVSPSPRDMSRENSPLQDLTLQSAPGSPEILMIKEEELYDVPESTEEVETTCEVETTDDQYN